MKEYSEFLRTTSDKDKSLAKEEMKNSLAELNTLPVILCASTNIDDSEVLKQSLQLE